MVLCCAICELVDGTPGEEWIYECPICKRRYSIYKDKDGNWHMEMCMSGIAYQGSPFKQADEEAGE